jgi:hypothetical protein
MRCFLTLLVMTACRNDNRDVPNDTVLLEEVDADADGYTTDEDCDDGDGAIHPGAVEICDGIDNNCDGTADEGVTSVFYLDMDGDGFGDPAVTVDACEQPSGTVSVPNDCDDRAAETYPGASERCDGEDNDCDGEIDEEVLDTWYADADDDGFGDPDSAYEVCDPPPGYVSNGEDCDDTNEAALPGGAEVCDEADNNCDGTIDEAVTTTYYQDVDNDGFGVADAAIQACDQPSGYAADIGDCNDSDATVSPNAAEVCDTIDNDCDGSADEDDAVDASTWYSDSDGDGYGNVDSTDVACSQPSGYVANNTDCDDTATGANPGATEYCTGADDDCDGTIDEDDAADASTWYADSDGDGYGTAVSTVACNQPRGFVDNSSDCDDGEALSNPGEAEICDSIDNDCDGSVDEALTSTYYADADGDGYGTSSYSTQACSAPSGYVEENTDCEDEDDSISPEQEETCNEVDDNCDGSVDEGLRSTFYTDSDGDGYGDSDATVEACAVRSGLVSEDGDCDDSDDEIYPGADETWYDGVDSDCSGGDDFDADGDGYASYLEDSGEDCDDGDATVYSCGDSQSAAIPSCLDLLELDSTRLDGLYWLDPDMDGDTSDAEEVYCDMTNDDGGWALVQWGADNDSANLNTDSAVGTLSASGQSSSAKLDRDFVAELASIGNAEFRYGHTDYGYIYLAGLPSSAISPGYGSTGFGSLSAPDVAALSYGGTTYANTLFSWPQNGVPQVCTNTGSSSAECSTGLHLGTWGGVQVDGVYMNFSTILRGVYLDIHYELWVK